MAGVENDLPVGELARRLGAKGPVYTWPIIPGIFPTMELVDAQGLVGGCERALGYGGQDIQLPAATGAEFWLYAKRPLFVYRIHLGAQFVNNIRWRWRKATTSLTPTAVRMDLGEIPVLSEVDVATPTAAPTVHFFALQSAPSTELKLRMTAGESLNLHAYNTGVAASFVGAGFLFEEIPKGAVDP